MKQMKEVKIVEVGLRDGLQNESTQLSVEQRLALRRGHADSWATEIHGDCPVAAQNLVAQERAGPSGEHLKHVAEAAALFR